MQPCAPRLGAGRVGISRPGRGVGEHQGKAQEGSLGSWHGLVVGTIHPSAVLRGPDPGSRDRAYAGLVSDLVLARKTAARQ